MGTANNTEPEAERISLSSTHVHTMPTVYTPAQCLPSAQHMLARCLPCAPMGQSLSLAVRGTKTSCHPSAHHLGEDASVLTSSFPFQKLLLHFLPRLCIRAPSSPAFDQFFPLTKSLRSSTSLLLLGSLRLCLQVNGILISIPSAEKCL